MTMIRWRFVDELKALGNNVSHTYGHITKSGRIESGIAKSHANDAFVIAGGRKQIRVKELIVKQVRRNNRALQMNRNGFKPSIRRKRYSFQPHDLVRYNSNVLEVKGIFNKGCYIRLIDCESNVINPKIEFVSSYKYMKGMVCI